jgi:hypothetical protein
MSGLFLSSYIFIISYRNIHTVRSLYRDDDGNDYDDDDDDGTRRLGDLDGKRWVSIIYLVVGHKHLRHSHLLFKKDGAENRRCDSLLQNL